MPSCAWMEREEPTTPIASHRRRSWRERSGGYAASPAFETTWRRETEWGRGSALSRDVCLPGCVHVCTCRVCVCMSMYACYVTNAWDRQAVYVPAVSCNVREYRL